MGAVVINGILGFIMMVTLCFTMGDIEDVLNSPTGFPFIQVFYNTTESYKASSAMVALVIIALTASVVSEIATASRQLWSFARDGGLPFSRFLSYVREVPPPHLPPSYS